MGNSDSTPKATQPEAVAENVGEMLDGQTSPLGKSAAAEAFEVLISPARSPAPARVLSQRNTPTHSPKTLSQIQDKLKAAEERRQEAEREKVARAEADGTEAVRLAKEKAAEAEAARAAHIAEAAKKESKAEEARARHIQEVVAKCAVHEVKPSTKASELQAKLEAEQEKAEHRRLAHLQEQKAKAEQQEAHAKEVREKAAKAPKE